MPIHCLARNRQRQLEPPVEEHMEQQVLTGTARSDASLKSAEFELIGGVGLSKGVCKVRAVNVENSKANVCLA